MITTVIIDDEKNAREVLEYLLLRHFPDKFLIVEKCASVGEAVIAINKHNPKLVFLDIQMPSKNGFELFKELDKISFEVVFTTAHSEFAIEAIKQSALDYLLKPINYIDLAKLVKRYEEKNHKASLNEKLLFLIDNLNSGTSDFNKVALATESGYQLVKTNSILYCQAESNYSTVVCLDGTKIVLAKTLKALEELLPQSIFQRIHRTYLVNLNHINKFSKVNDLYVELVNGEMIPVSTRNKQALVNAINKK